MCTVQTWYRNGEQQKDTANYIQHPSSVRTTNTAHKHQTVQKHIKTPNQHPSHIPYTNMVEEQ
jgi:hypothetical protein